MRRASGWKRGPERRAAKRLSIGTFLCYFYLQKFPKSLSSDAFFELKFHLNPFLAAPDPAGEHTSYDAPLSPWSSEAFILCSIMRQRCFAENPSKILFNILCFLLTMFGRTDGRTHARTVTKYNARSHTMRGEDSGLMSGKASAALYPDYATADYNYSLQYAGDAHQRWRNERPSDPRHSPSIYSDSTAAAA